MIYRDTFQLPDEHDSVGREQIEEYIRGRAYDVQVSAQQIAFEVRAFDLWEMRETTAEIELELQAMGVNYFADRENIVTDDD